MDFLKRANELYEDTVADRRYMHTNAEAGLDLPHTKKYVMDRLKAYGLEPRECGHGVVATVGSGGKVILLKSDMDALPMPEKSGLDFACPTGTEAHTCGHDMNAAMLLTAARMLKEAEHELKGTVKIMFEPTEEIFKGGKDMIAAGVLENPTVDAALSFHVGPGGPPGGYFYNNQSTFMASCDGFRIRVKGAGSHGAYPHHSKRDPGASRKQNEGNCENDRRNLPRRGRGGDLHRCSAADLQQGIYNSDPQLHGADPLSEPLFRTGNLLQHI